MGVHDTLLTVIGLLAGTFLGLWVFLGQALRVAPAASGRFAIANLALAASVLLTLQRSGTAAAVPAWAAWPVADVLGLSAFWLARGGVQALFKLGSTARRDALGLGLVALVFAGLPVGPTSLRAYFWLYSCTAAWLLAGLARDLWRATRQEFGARMAWALASPFAAAALLMAGRLLGPLPGAQAGAAGDPLGTLWAFVVLALLLNGSLVVGVLARLLLVLRQRAERDHLTQLYNRRHFDHLLALEWARAQRQGAAFCLLLLDLDHFKRINDALGHAGGDAALRHAAQVLQAGCRGIDTLARHGGEEFALLLPGTPLAGGLDMAERLRQRLAAQGFVHAGRAHAMTASLGVAHSDGQPSLEALCRQADQALYAAQGAGRDCVRAAPAPLKPPGAS